MAQNLSAQRTPAKNFTALVTGEVDNGRRRRSRTARRSRIDIDGDRLAELLHRLLAGDRSGLPTEICAADRERTRSAEDLSSQPMVGHPQGNRPLRVAEIHPQAWLHPADDRQRSRPVPSDEVIDVLGDLRGQCSYQRRVADEHRRWHLASTSLNVQQPLHSVSVESIGADALDRVGRQHDAFAALDGGSRLVDGRGALFGVVGRAVEDPECHAAILPVTSAGLR